MDFASADGTILLALLGSVAGIAQFIRGAGPARGRFRLTEHCILTGETYDAIGSCIENPRPTGEHNRNMITKGQNEATFLISFRGEREFESKLRWRALGYILGGAAMVVACTAVLIWKLVGF